MLSPLFCEDTRGIVAERDGTPVACILFDSWTHTSAQSHIWIGDRMVLRHGFLEEAARYFFEESGRRILLGITPSNKTRALKLNKHIGFRVIGVIKNGFDDGVDLVVQRMNGDDCRVLPGERRDGRKKQRTTGT